MENEDKGKKGEPLVSGQGKSLWASTRELVENIKRGRKTGSVKEPDIPRLLSILPGPDREWAERELNLDKQASVDRGTRGADSNKPPVRRVRTSVEPRFRHKVSAEDREDGQKETIVGDEDTLLAKSEAIRVLNEEPLKDDGKLAILSRTPRRMVVSMAAQQAVEEQLKQMWLPIEEQEFMSTKFRRNLLRYLIGIDGQARKEAMIVAESSQQESEMGMEG